MFYPLKETDKLCYARIVLMLHTLYQWAIFQQFLAWLWKMDDFP